MSLFQHSVISKYIQEQRLSEASSLRLDVNTSFEKFTKYFGNPEIQHNIRDSKEEQYQEGFLRSLFVDILGYTPNPEQNFNLLTEQKDQKGSKKADAVILRPSNLAGLDNLRGLEQVLAVIELKGTDTVDLSKVETQAFSYKNNQKGCVYVITSNFEKLRFYIDNAVDFEEFNLFCLTKESFELLYFCLAKDNLLNNLPQKIRDASITKEEQITKQLYSDYSTFKRILFDNITALNPKFDKLTLFRKTQKLLDRFLFILFAEDRLLLPPNSIREIIKQWEYFRDNDNYVPLYERFIKYFGYMNTGYKGKQYEIFAYNGGLFAPDDILDKIKIDDTILYEHTTRLSKYDFDTEIDVNILGHIFEHSLNEIEEIQAELEGKVVDKNKTKRKKDGIFYTPKYITKYIVENTVGALCTDKKKELGIDDMDGTLTDGFTRLSPNRPSTHGFTRVLPDTPRVLPDTPHVLPDTPRVLPDTPRVLPDTPRVLPDTPRGSLIKRKELLDKIDSYRNWLLKLTICDPACGSGAFLNQALDFLINEHRKLDELIARITKSSIVFSNIENSILENNIFGVDLNEEAVEIAKLSLWLKTAHKGRKLSMLSNNIKCGNSLIDDPNVSGEKAFNWFFEFPQVFPSYRLKNLHSLATIVPEPEPGDREYLDEMQEPSYSYKAGSKGFEKHGFDVIIGNPPYVPTEFIKQSEKEYYKLNFTQLERKYDTSVIFILKGLSILKEKGLLSYISSTTWQTGKNYKSLRNHILTNNGIKQIINLPFDVFADAYVETCIYVLNKVSNPTYQIYNFDKKIKLSNLDNIAFNTIETKNINQDDFKIILNNQSNAILEKIKKNPSVQSFGNISISTQGLSGSKFDKFTVFSDDYYPFLLKGQVYRYSFNILETCFTSLESYKTLKPFYVATPKLLIRRLISRQDRLLVGYTSDKLVFTKDINPFIISDSDFDAKFVMAILNSKLISYLYVNASSIAAKDDFRQTTLTELRNIPIIKTDKDSQNAFIEKVNLIITKKELIQNLTSCFIKFLTNKFQNLTFPKSFQDLSQLEFNDFLKLLSKNKIKLSIIEQSEWLDYFQKEKDKAIQIQSEINRTDEEIDEMVYKLYELNEEEIKIVSKN